MLKLLVISALLALTTANNIDGFLGQWRPIKEYTKSKEPVIKECQPIYAEDLKEYCTCGADSKISKIKLTFANQQIVSPVDYVDFNPIFKESLTKKCTCDGKKIEHYAAYQLTDNYTILMHTDDLNNAVLLGKTVPSEADLVLKLVDEFITSWDNLKNSNSHFVCSKEIMNSK
ncbi:hypothetical protein O0L34_g8527 [Tuta absoluta]|nr:hypothetical protein O0L34_g8527 [Tuta absoluta]